MNPEELFSDAPKSVQYSKPRLRAPDTRFVRTVMWRIRHRERLHRGVAVIAVLTAATIAFAIIDPYLAIWTALLPEILMAWAADFSNSLTAWKPRAGWRVPIGKWSASYAADVAEYARHAYVWMIDCFAMAVFSLDRWLAR